MEPSLYMKHWIVTEWYHSRRDEPDKVLSKIEFADENEARAFIATKKAENKKVHGWTSYDILERFIPVTAIAGLDALTVIPPLVKPDEDLSRAERFFRDHPGCNKIIDCGSAYPADSNGHILCAKNVGYANDCPAADMLDCRDCWNSKIGEET